MATLPGNLTEMRPNTETHVKSALQVPPGPQGWRMLWRATMAAGVAAATPIWAAASANLMTVAVVNCMLGATRYVMLSYYREDGGTGVGLTCFERFVSAKTSVHLL